MFVFCAFVFQNLQVEGEENFPSAFDELGQLGEENVVVSGKGREKKTANKQLLEKRIQYATRGKKHSYCEPEVPDDDHYICEWNNNDSVFFTRCFDCFSWRVRYGSYTCESGVHANAVYLFSEFGLLCDRALTYTRYHQIQ